MEDDVSFFHGVTLGGTGDERGDRHPKIGRNVLLGANATLLGNIHIGEGSKIGAGSVCFKIYPRALLSPACQAKWWANTPFIVLVSKAGCLSQRRRLNQSLCFEPSGSTPRASQAV